MNESRKHRIYVDVTFSNSLTKRNAAQGLRLVLERLDLDKAPIWAYHNSPYVDKIIVLESQKADR